MNRSRLCRHCGSPARGRPCWWRLRRKNHGADPPCALDAYNEDQRRGDQRTILGLLAFACAAFLVAIVLIH